ncbi:SCO7613 C-terminal domain-containing membrane protein [Actinoplanes sp. NPDC051859]|uniref:SCO7613 C-terminal domain-containing membrane protein n=1 Tax=Actinoplanes sp. NPDC051859 TaxID=3363909 RepID=UPI0037AB9BDB
MAQADEPEGYDDELARIDASIAELKVRDLAAAKERTTIASKIQAAQFQRDILAHANQQRKRAAAAKSTRRVRRRPTDPPTPSPGGHQGAPPPGAGGRVAAAGGRTAATSNRTAAGHPSATSSAATTDHLAGAGHATTAGHPAETDHPAAAGRTTAAGRTAARASAGRPAWSAPGTPYTGPPGQATDGVTVLVDDPPPTEEPAYPPPRRRVAPPPEHPPHEPETSSQSVQNILLGLSALVLGVAAVVFAGAASNAVGRALILAVATGVALTAAPAIARRGLTSTGETLAAVGLVLLPMTLYALHGSPALGGDGVPSPVFLGVTLLITTAAAFAYAGVTRLSAPRYATVVAVQPVPPLLAYPMIESPAGWAVTLTIVAIVDLLLLTTVIRSGRLVPRWPVGRPVAGDRESLAEADARDIGARDFATRHDPADPGSHDPAAVDAGGDPAGADAGYGTPDRPESRPEEPDLIIAGLTGRKRRRWLPTRIFPGKRPEGAPPAGSVPLMPPSSPPAAGWLRQLTFGLLCLAAAGALLYASAGLAGADAVVDAVRSGLILILAAVTASAAARLVDHVRARSIAGAVLTIAIIAACARIADVASPAWTLAVAAAAVAVTGAAVRLLPDEVRRGPQYASAAALTVIGLFVAVDALRAALAPVQAARPVWNADTAAYAGRIADAAGQSGWLLALSALLATVAAALALPTEYRREGAVTGVALTALAVPSSLGLPWSEAPWPLVVAGIGIGAAGLLAPTRRVAGFHVAAAGVVGAFGAAAALSASWLTAAVLTALAGAGVMVAVAARQMPVRLYAWLVGDWASGAAALAIPGAVVTAVLAVDDPGGGPPATEAVTVPALALGFLAVAGTLTYAAVFQVARREVSVPMTAGAGLGAIALALAALLSPGATAPDVWVGALLLVAAALLFFAKSLDNGRRADRMLDGPDIAAAAATVAVCGALARVAALAFPDAPLAVGAIVVLIVAFGVHALPEDWRRGPVRGVGLAGLVVGAIAAWQALADGLRIIAAPGPIWASDVSGYPTSAEPGAWQAPVALILIAVAATAALPRPARYDVSAVAVALATIGAPAALGLPWWSPLLIGGAVALGYGIASVAAVDPRAALSRAGVAAAVALHAAGAGLVRPWSTALALGLIVATGVLVAWLARADLTPAARRTWAERAELDEVVAYTLDDTGMPRHRAQIGGAATMAALLAAPGVLAAVAAGQGRTAQVVLTAALAGSSLMLAFLAVAGRWVPQYLPWATIGLVGGATITALASVPSDYPTALYAAAAALLGVVAELLRGTVPAPGLTLAPPHTWREDRLRQPRRGLRPSGLRGRWLVGPATGAVIVASLPTILALFSIAPALRAALIDPMRQLDSIWNGPVAALTDPASGSVDGTSVLATVLLTVAAALAALGFGGKPAEAVPVILPGLAITLLIAPIALDARWPASTAAALVVFTIVMLGLALTPPPVTSRATLLHTNRTVVFVIGLLAGGAGLAGSLATQQLTLFTLGSAIGVGLIAAVAGKSRHARVLGWLFAAGMGQFFVLAVALVGGLTHEWAAFGVLAVGAALLILEAVLPRLGLPEYRLEATTVEWSGYASALLAGALAFDSPAHLAALLAAWGAVLGLTATRPGRTPEQRRNLFWLAVGFEIIGIWLFVALADVALPEAYTLPFAALALLVGVLEARQRPELGSWAAYGPALLAAFVPTTGLVIATDAGDLREMLLLLGAVATLIIGSRLQQQAPVVIGAAATAVATIHFATTLVGPWLVLVPVGVILLFLGATNENRRRTQERLRGALVRMR